MGSGLVNGFFSMVANQIWYVEISTVIFFYIIKLFRYVNIINLKNKKNYFKIKNTLKNNPYYIFKQTQNLIHIERINLN